MNELTIHPNVYQTSTNKGLIHLLEKVWVRDFKPGDGTIYVISGFGNFNGGVRFYDIFRRHIDSGGKLVAIFGGSTSSRLTSKQVVAELLEAGAEVHVVNRKRLMHAKSYGRANDGGDALIVTSGNFTGPGMAQNVEMAVLLDQATTKGMNFSWADLVKNMLSQNWDIYQPALVDRRTPAWSLLYDEQAANLRLDETEEVTMITRLSHADTARIMADKGTKAGKGTQYFWLSKDSFDFLPPLTILNRRGYKTTYSAMVDVLFVDIKVEKRVRVTFEAENNLDFRFGTGPLKYSKLCGEGDFAAITRRGEARYEVRVFKQGSAAANALGPYATTFVGHQGKRYGFIANSAFYDLLGIPRPRNRGRRVN